MTEKINQSDSCSTSNSDESEEFIRETKSKIIQNKEALNDRWDIKKLSRKFKIRYRNILYYLYDNYYSSDQEEEEVFLKKRMKSDGSYEIEEEDNSSNFGSFLDNNDKKFDNVLNFYKIDFKKPREELKQIFFGFENETCDLFES